MNYVIDRPNESDPWLVTKKAIEKRRNYDTVDALTYAIKKINSGITEKEFESRKAKQKEIEQIENVLKRTIATRSITGGVSCGAIQCEKCCWYSKCSELNGGIRSYLEQRLKELKGTWTIIRLW